MTAKDHTFFTETVNSTERCDLVVYCTLFKVGVALVPVRHSEVGVAYMTVILSKVAVA